MLSLQQGSDLMKSSSLGVIGLDVFSVILGISAYSWAVSQVASLAYRP